MNQDKNSISILIAALGGEGGGTLTDWIAEAARLSGMRVQCTSIPGVAQRTGATTYYIELAQEDSEQALALTPMPVPATALVTPVFDKTHEPVVAVLAIPTPDTPSAVTPVLFTIGYAAEPESVIAVPPPTASTPEPELCVQ